MKAVFSPRALADLNELLSYVKAQDARTAASISETIDRAIRRCAAQPRIGSTTNRKHVYRLPIRKYGLTIF